VRRARFAARRLSSSAGCGKPRLPRGPAVCILVWETTDRKLMASLAPADPAWFASFPGENRVKVANASPTADAGSRVHL